MSIDLTRPIRTKDKKVAVTHLTYRYDVCGMLEAEFSNGGTLTCDANELTTYFENIPEPRRVREWFLQCGVGNGWEVRGYFADLDHNARIRVIEWPEGAPAPSWPEGY